MQRVLLLSDLSYQVYRACAAFPQLSSRRVFTGGIYGFFVSWAKAVRETRATDCVFCTDLKPYRRSEAYPEYKQLRTGTMDPELKERFTESLPIVLDALRRGGLPVWGVRGFESDDLVGHAVGKYRGRYDAIYAQSNDSDLWQLFGTPRFRVYTGSMAKLHDASTLMANLGLTPEQFVLAAALQGTHNDIAGIPNVGPKTAAKAVLSPALLRKYMAEHGPMIERNLGLIRLPHPEFPAGERMPRQESTPDRAREFWRTLSNYDIEVTGTMMKAYGQVTGN